MPRSYAIKYNPTLNFPGGWEGGLRKMERNGPYEQNPESTTLRSRKQQPGIDHPTPLCQRVRDAEVSERPLFESSYL